MKLPKSLTTVTPFSKFLAAILFVTLPLSTFYLGTKLMITPQISNRTPQEVVQVKREETFRDLLKRCGDLPSDTLNIRAGHYTVKNGPDWAPDCRHIAWSLWESGTAVISNEGPSPTPVTHPLSFEGVYLYTDATKQIRKIYTPKSPNETPSFTKWLDRDTFLFRVRSEDHIYNVVTGETKPLIEKQLTQDISETPYPDDPELEKLALSAMSAYLETYRSPSVAADHRIVDYKVDKIDQVHIKNGELRFHVIYAVKIPQGVPLSEWTAGNGGLQSDGWVIDKTEWVSGVKTASGYEVQGTGTGVGRDF